MLTEPASKVSVPLVAVKRMRSRVPDVVLEYPQVSVLVVFDLPLLPLIAHKLEPMLVIVKEPCETDAALRE